MQERRMTFGEHLEELRRRVLYSLLGVGGAFLLCFSVLQDPLFEVMVWPHRRAMEGATERRLRAEGALEQKLARVFPEPAERGFAERVIQVLREERLLREPYRATLQAIRYPEAFVSAVKISLIFSLILAAPLVLWQLWLFIAEGLYPQEKRVVRTFLPVSIGLFASGIFFGYFVMVPVSLRFLGTWADPGLVEGNFTLAEYLNLFFVFTLALGAVFELPLGMLIVERLGLVDARSFRAKRRYAVLGIATLAAIITPTGDPVTLALLGFPVYLLYELGIVFLRLFPGRRPVAGPLPEGRG